MQFGTESKLNSDGWKTMIKFPPQQRYSSWGREGRLTGSGLFLVYETLFPMESLGWAKVTFVLGAILTQSP